MCVDPEQVEQGEPRGWGRSNLPPPPPRSHPTILDIPNRLYYEGELQACADVVDRERFCRWEGLPRQVRLNRAGTQAAAPVPQLPSY